mmetsp:Transcript_36360/g.82943  ORF Transcript_36360/g.82943 Transcript_36360/m.82943 type:complete len:909 (-) Transcript_36360:331-3057(-)
MTEILERPSKRKRPDVELGLATRPPHADFRQHVRVMTNHVVVRTSPDLVVHAYHVEIEGISRSGEARTLRRPLEDQDVRSRIRDLGERLHICIISDGRHTAFIPNQKLEEGDLICESEAEGPNGKPWKLRFTFALTDTFVFREFQPGKQELNHDVVRSLDIATRFASSFKFFLINSTLFNPKSFSACRSSPGSCFLRGQYQAITHCENGFTLNIEPAAGVFYEPVSVYKYLEKTLGSSFRAFMSGDPRSRRDATRAMQGIKVEKTHMRSAPFTIKGFADRSLSEEYFDLKGKQVSVADFFRQKYHADVDPRAPGAHLPGSRQFIRREGCFNCGQAGHESRECQNAASSFCGKCGQEGHMKSECTAKLPKPAAQSVPLECLQIIPGQKIRKLSPGQTAELIKLTKRCPADTRKEVTNLLQDLRLHEDTHVRKFQLSIDVKPLMIPAEKLPVVQILLGGGRNLNGPAWNMVRNQYKATGAPLTAWCVLGLYDARCNPRQFEDEVTRFAQDFQKVAEQRGLMNRDCPRPIFHFGGHPVSATFKEFYDKLPGNPQLVIVIVPRRNCDEYREVKWVSDVTFGFPTQCVSWDQYRAQKNPDQYLNNIMLKVNAKLGGVNWCLSSPLPKISAVPSIIFGIDVSHPAPGSFHPSVAAVTCTVDELFCSHAGTFRAQSSRQEAVDPDKLKDMVKDLLKTFYNKTEVKPARVIIFRDGVSEGEFGSVLASELGAFRAAFQELEEGYNPPVTFISCQKRHHTRLLPAPDDREMMDDTGNVPAGVLVDTGIVSGHYWDFYILTHSGIGRGPGAPTTRPAKYSVLKDENGFTSEEMAMLIWPLCHLYQRSTRTVSLVPSAYYAHLLAARGEKLLASEGAGLDSDTASHCSGSSDQARLRAEAFSADFGGVHKNLRDSMFFV